MKIAGLYIYKIKKQSQANLVYPYTDYANDNVS